MRATPPLRPAARRSRARRFRSRPRMCQWSSDSTARAVGSDNAQSLSQFAQTAWSRAHRRKLLRERRRPSVPGPIREPGRGAARSRALSRRRRSRPSLRLARESARRKRRIARPSARRSAFSNRDRERSSQRARSAVTASAVRRPRLSSRASRSRSRSRERARARLARMGAARRATAFSRAIFAARAIRARASSSSASAAGSARRIARVPLSRIRSCFFQKQTESRTGRYYRKGRRGDIIATSKRRPTSSRFHVAFRGAEDPRPRISPP
jgi:hypothetical protein